MAREVDPATIGATLHELRNLLTPAVMLTERLQSNADPAVRQIADRIARSLDRAVALISPDEEK